MPRTALTRSGFLLTMLFFTPVALARPSSPPARLREQAIPAELRSALLDRHQHRLSEALRQQKSPAPIFLPIADAPVRFKVPTLNASLGFDFSQKVVTAGMDFQVVAQAEGLDQIFLVAAEELLGSQMVVSDPIGELSVINAGQGARGISLRQPLGKGQSVQLSMKWQGKASCQTYCSVSAAMTYNLYTSWLPIIYDISGLSGGVVYPSLSKLSVTVPAPLVVAASGDGEESTSNPDGSTTYRFQEKRFGRFNIAVAPFTLETSSGATPMVRSFLRAPLASAGKAWRQAASEILSFHTKQFGSYDFGKADLVEVSDSLSAGGTAGVAGLSLVFMPSSGFTADASDWRARQTLAHELAHQWFGMMIHNVEAYYSPWLSEGFATFAESEYTAAAGASTGQNLGAAIRRMNALIYMHVARKTGDVPLSSSKIYDADQLVYLAVTYYKGALVAGMLKYLLGEQAFQAGLISLKQQHADSATVATLLASLKAASGTDLAGFAQKWIYGSGYPSYQVSLRRSAGKPDQVVLESATDFGMPIELQLLGSDGKRLRERVKPVGTTATYTAPAGVQILQVRPDPDAQILGRFLPGLEGDVHLNGEVDGIDLITQAWAVGQSFSLADMADPTSAAPFDDRADLVFDGNIDQQDLDLVLAAFGKQS